jgi:hypothetical protein
MAAKFGSCVLWEETIEGSGHRWKDNIEWNLGG